MHQYNLKSISIFCKIVFCILFFSHNLYSQNTSSVTIKLLIEGLYTGGTTLASPLFTNDLSTNQEHSDSVDVILAQSNPPFTVLASTRALLLNNGIATAVFPNMTPGQNCYIIIKHRNSVETWSKNPVLISQVTYYNFTGIHQFPEVYGILDSIGITGARSIGAVISDGGSAVTARGFCWNTAPQPTVSLTTKTVDGSGIGSFLSNITGLKPSTTYYIRAYATNDVGTAYGIETTFSTSISDIDGNIYSTIPIGDQVWTSENLKVSKYRNGDPIPTGLSNTSWNNTTDGAYAIYNNLAANDQTYGKLYNWYAVDDPRGLCPAGSHEPDDVEWSTLLDFLGANSNSMVGGKMKSVSPLWIAPNTAADNSSGFNGLPGGCRDRPGSFSNIGIFGYWWSSTNTSTLSAKRFFLSHDNGYILISTLSKRSGFSVRCVGNKLPTVITNSVFSNTSNGATFTGDVAFSGGDPVTARGFCWSTNPNPTVDLTSFTVDGSGTGFFTSTITGLEEGTVYYVRAYATNDVGTAYGNEISFTTPTLPNVSTTAVSNVSNTSAVSGGTVNSDGGSPITARGVCWSMLPNPTISLSTKTVDGNGTGAFISNITSLGLGNSYFVRAYATNAAGTSYGEELQFTTTNTTPTLPNISTTAVSNISNTSAVSGGTVNSDGGSPITARGVCWSMLPNPTISLSTKTVDGNGTGAFISNITSLGLGNSYFVRAYATNAAGTSYGEELQFTTTNVPSGPCPSGVGSVTDIDGNYYPVVTIGNQCWMRENLRTTKYRNGSNIPTNLNATAWETTSNGAYYDYSNNSNLINTHPYGNLYNGYAVSDPSGLCPVGWHVPSDAEWKTLEAFLGMPANELDLSNIGAANRGELQNVGGKMKTVNTIFNQPFHWVSTNSGANNASLFSAYPSGNVLLSNVPNPIQATSIGNNAFFWSSTLRLSCLLPTCPVYLLHRSLSYANTAVYRAGNEIKNGFSVRCVRD